MTVYLNEHRFAYETENLCRLFFPDEKISIVEDAEIDHCNEEEFSLFLSYNGDVITAEFAFDGKKTVRTKESDDSRCDHDAAVLVYEYLVELTGFEPKWGILTGIRPVKLLRMLVSQRGENEARKIFREEFRVSEEKTDIAFKTLGRESAIIDLSEKDSFSLYVSIPFCPSRCSYCSFVSQSVENAKKLIPEYVDYLCKELEYTAEIVKKTGLKLETVYFGGGTPTTLEAEQLDKLLKTVTNSFDLTGLREFTVEAGRPDTITREKLIALKQNGVGRISINPQTFNDEVLNVIGRRHTAAQTIEAMELAKSIGFDNINMDLIAGLPADTQESFANTVDTAIGLEPESITVHTLSIKRASNLVYTGDARYNAQGLQAASMIEHVNNRLFASGYLPYYLYRQSRTLGNLENVGWSKEGHEGYYNVYMMDETHSILACGAGAVTKIKERSGKKIERFFNYKFPYEYITGFDEMINRKEKAVHMIEELC